jgi:hypothetical protein
MSKTRSKLPAEETQPARRSLADLTASVKQAVEDGLLAAPASPVVALAEQPRRLERVTELPERKDGPEQPVASARAAAAQSTTGASRRRDYAASDSAAEMMVQIVKDYQSRVLTNIKTGLNAALDQAKDFVEAKDTRETTGDVSESDGRNALGAATTAFRAEVLELMQANVVTTLGFARELAGARTAAEFVELTGTQARKNCELVLKQADAVKSLAQAIAKDRADSED